MDSDKSLKQLSSSSDGSVSQSNSSTSSQTGDTRPTTVPKYRPLRQSELDAMYQWSPIVESDEEEKTSPAKVQPSASSNERIIEPNIQKYQNNETPFLNKPVATMKPAEIMSENDNSLEASTKQLVLKSPVFFEITNPKDNPASEFFGGLTPIRPYKPSNKNLPAPEWRNLKLLNAGLNQKQPTRTKEESKSLVTPISIGMNNVLTKSAPEDTIGERPSKQILNLPFPKPMVNEMLGDMTPVKSCVSNGSVIAPQSKKLWGSSSAANKKPTQKVLYSIDMDQYLNTPINRPPSKATTTSMQKIPKALPVAAKNISNKENDTPEQNVSDVFKIIKVKRVNYYVLKQLGKGGSSVVYHCFEPKQELDCAIKVVNLNQDQGAVAGFLNEVKMLQRLQKCRRVIKLHSHEVLREEKKMLMVLEKGGKDLSQILRDIKSATTHLPMYMLFYYWMGMLYAVKDIHLNGVIHSDLKPANFLEINGEIKLIDFGISSMIQKDMTSVVKNVALGTFSYISPEALHNEGSTQCDSPSYGKAKYKISFKSDVWSLGCILYQLVYKRTPFQHIGHTWAKLAMIMDPNHKIDYPTEDWVPQSVVNTIKHCLQYEMRSRPSIDDLIKQYESMCT